MSSIELSWKMPVAFSPALRAAVKESLENGKKDKVIIEEHKISAKKVQQSSSYGPIVANNGIPRLLRCVSCGKQAAKFGNSRRRKELDPSL